MNPGCAPFEPELSAFVDGELAPPLRARVEAHVAACPRCAAEVRELRRVGESLRRWEAHETRCAPSTGFRNRVMARVGAECRSADPEPVRLWRRTAWAAAAAAAVVAAFAWSHTRPGAVAPLDVADARRRADALDAALRERIAAAPEAPAPAGVEVPSIGELAPVVGMSAARAPSPVRAAEEDPWEPRGEGMLLRDAVADHERFIADRRRLAGIERFARSEPEASGVASSSGTTAGGPQPTAMATLLGQVSVVAASLPASDGVQVWPIELAATARGARLLLAEAALDEDALRVSEDSQGNVVAENADLKGRPVLLLAGDVLRGGRRDRVLRESVLLAPGRRMSLPAAAASGVRTRGALRTFVESRLAAPADLRAFLAAGSFGEGVDQRDVDEIVRASLVDLASQGGIESIENLWRNAELQREAKRQVETLRRRLDRPGVVGFVVSVGGDVVGAEMCGDADTFRLVRDRLLRSYVLFARSRPGETLRAVPPSDAAAASFLTAATRAVFDDPAASGDGGLSLFRTLDGRIFGAGIADGSRVLHASVWAGVPASGSGGGRPSRGGLGRGPGLPGGSARDPSGAPDRSGGPAPGGGLDAR